MRLRGAILDLDGTLLDSMSVWDTLGEDYLRTLGIRARPGLYAALKDLSLDQAARYLQREYALPLSLEEIMAGVNRRLEHFYRQEVPMKPGADQLLAQLRRRGVRLCLATATDLPLAKAALERLGLLPCFDAILTCNQVGHGKDEPCIYEAALQTLGTKKEETLVFEDALYALRTAKAAGFPITAVYDAHELEQEAVRALADLWLEDFSQLDRLWDFDST